MKMKKLPVASCQLPGFLRKGAYLLSIVYLPALLAGCLLFTVIHPAFAEKNLGTFKGLGGYIPETIGADINPFSLIIADFLSNIITFLTILAGIYFLIYFMVGALKWISSGGNREKVEEAKKSLTNAAIGLIVVAAAYTIAFIVGKVLGIDFLDIQKMMGTFWSP